MAKKTDKPDATPPAAVPAAPNAESKTKSLDTATLIRKITGKPAAACNSLAGKLSDEEKENLEKAYTTNTKARGVLSKAVDRITDEAIAAKKEASKS